MFSLSGLEHGISRDLKGFVDRVFLPGVSFNLKDDGSYVPCLHNIKRLGAVCTYGGAAYRPFSWATRPAGSSSAQCA